VPDAWDTSVASRIAAGERHAALLAAHRREDIFVALPAPTIQEIVRGLATPAQHHARARLKLRWFGHLFRDPLTIVVPFDRPAAELAGHLLARLPHPPSRNHRRAGTRAQQRAAWALDVQIAACAFAGGYGVLTENVEDFALLRDAIGELLPGVPPLAVSDALELARPVRQPSTRMIGTS
jgi:predicted nucleic acid-binding protein